MADRQKSDEEKTDEAFLTKEYEATGGVGTDASADGAGFTELCVLVEEVPGKEPREHELHIEANSFELTVDVWNDLTKASIALDPDQVRVLLVALNAWLIGR